MKSFYFEISIIFFTLIALLIGFIFLFNYYLKKIELHSRWLGDKLKKKKKDKLTKRIASLTMGLAKKLAPRSRTILSFRNVEKDKKQLQLAGNPYGMSVDIYYGLKLVLGAVGGVLFFISMILGDRSLLIWSTILAFLGFMWPDIWISLKAKERQRKIGEEMPDFLDTISVMLQAGSSLDGSLRTSTQYMKGPLYEEIKKFNQEIELGVPRKTAYENLMKRNNSKELSSLVQSLIQGTELGVPVAQTFQVQAEDLRSSRGSLAKEKAAKANPKISLVTTFLIAPALFFLIVGLLVLNLIYNPENFGVSGFF
ncbi:type II secretion system F family protein [Gracilibacillus dipsosauri]|uniref:type II secretion system F family protein n=1 Tax=Gracilibacillus dipsosauri TaxID=178340 RepID=UPI0024098367